MIPFRRELKSNSVAVAAPKQSRITVLSGARPGIAVCAPLVLIGFTAVVAQVVLMRELLVVFAGNEISLGVTLANWLLWTAAGSGLLGRLGSRRDPRRVLAALQALAALAFPATIILVRASRAAFHPVPGESLGPGAMFLASFFALSLFCAVSGCLFSAGARLYASVADTTAAIAAPRVYLLEAAGSGIGGVLASVALIRYLDAFHIAALLLFLNLLAAGLAFSRRRRPMALMAGVLIFVVGWLAAPRLQQMSIARLWRGFQVTASRDSVYGNLVVTAGEASRSLYENGVNLFNVPDPAAAEEAVHYALLEHPAPRRVLLLGGGINGSAAEALRHPSVERVDYVELDPAIFTVARAHLAPQWSQIQSDARIRIHIADGRLYLKTTSEQFDVIIVNLPDPQTAQLNRFYTLEFFREAAAKFAPGGVLALQLRSSENYIGPELAAFLGCVNETLLAVFPEVRAIPGETVHFFASNRRGVLATGSDELLARLRERRLQTSYVREYYLPFRMMPDRMAEIAAQIRPRAQTAVNRDFFPIAYYFDVALWSGQFSQGYRHVLQRIAQISFFRVTIGSGVVLLILAAALFWLPTRDHRASAGAGFCVAAMGFTQIGLEVLLLLGFQAIYGYVYHQLAIVIAAFMAGMALGSWRALRQPRAEGIRAVAFLQLLAAASPIVLYGLLEGLALVRSPAGLFMISQIVFPLVALACGALGGYQFPLATCVFAGDKNSRGPGTLYALDLVGACLAAILLSGYLVPVFGFLKTAILIAVVNLAPAAVAGLAPQSRSSPAHPA